VRWIKNRRNPALDTAIQRWGKGTRFNFKVWGCILRRRGWIVQTSRWGWGGQDAQVVANWGDERRGTDAVELPVSRAVCRTFCSVSDDSYAENSRKSLHPSRSPRTLKRSWWPTSLATSSGEFAHSAPVFVSEVHLSAIPLSTFRIPTPSSRPKRLQRRRTSSPPTPTPPMVRSYWGMSPHSTRWSSRTTRNTSSLQIGMSILESAGTLKDSTLRCIV